VNDKEPTGGEQAARRSGERPVLVSDLAKQLGRDRSNTLRDLKKRGYYLHGVRAPSGQTVAAISREQADRYLAERRVEAEEGVGMPPRAQPTQPDVTDAVADLDRRLGGMQAALDLLKEELAKVKAAVAPKPTLVRVVMEPKPDPTPMLVSVKIIDNGGAWPTPGSV
jgi:hypothetical protein